MKHLILITFSIIFSKSYLGQKHYNQIINQAELAIVDNNFKEANKLYKSLFENDYMFVKDLWNYTFSLIKDEDTLMAKKCVVEMLKNDILKRRIEENDLLNKIYHSIESPEPEKNVTNLYLYNLIDSLHAQDQKYRNVDYAYKVYKSEIQKIDSVNSEVLKKIFETNGIPSEDQIGSKQMFNLKMLLLHQNNNPNKYIFSEFILNGIKNGKIEPYEWARVYTLVSGEDIYGMINSVFKMSYSTLNSEIINEKQEMANNQEFILGYYNSKPADLLKYKTNRKAIGIGSFFESRKKMIYKIKNDDCPFMFQSFNHRVFTDKKQYDFFLKGLNIIKIKE